MSIKTNLQTMKNFTHTLRNATCIILLISISAFVSAQTKKEVQFSLDTLKKSHNSLQEDYRAVKAAWKKQNNFFEHVKSTFFLSADINTSIDSGIVKFDKINSALLIKLEKLGKNNKNLKDSLFAISSNIDSLELQNRAYNHILLSSLSHASFPQSTKDFLGTWDLFLNPVQLSGEPYESGIIGFNEFVPNDSIGVHNIYKIEFLEDELATVHFKGGTSQKCFYSVKDFSNNSPYIIKFSKNDDFKMTMLISPLPGGLMVSYEIPVKAKKIYYYYGLMKK